MRFQTDYWKMQQTNHIQGLLSGSLRSGGEPILTPSSNLVIMLLPPTTEQYLGPRYVSKLRSILFVHRLPDIWTSIYTGFLVAYLALDYAWSTNWLFADDCYSFTWLHCSSGKSSCSWAFQCWKCQLLGIMRKTSPIEAGYSIYGHILEKADTAESWEFTYTRSTPGHPTSTKQWRRPATCTHYSSKFCIWLDWPSRNLHMGNYFNPFWSMLGLYRTHTVPKKTTNWK